jgi:hypothetical protein
MTLMDRVVPTSSGQNVADLSKTGPSVDLVGVGYTVAVNLTAYKMDDVIASFFWRNVDLTRGAIELFLDPNFTNVRQIIFLDEFESGKIHDLRDWRINDSATSARWRTMVDRQTAALFADPDGKGKAYNNISGSITTKEDPDFRNYGFDDVITSFRWDPVVPIKEVIAPIELTSTTATISGSLVASTSGTNSSSFPQLVTVSISNDDAQTVSISTEDQFATSISSTLSMSATAKAGVPGAAEAEATTTWSVTVAFDYTHSVTRSTSTTKSVKLDISQQVTAPPESDWEATLEVKIGQIPPTM